MKPKLPVHEWIAIWAIISLLFTITLITAVFNNSSTEVPTDPPHLLIAENIEIVIEGAVENPGCYQVKRGSRVEDILALGKPLPDADIRRLKLKAKVRDGQFIRIPRYQMITVFLEGEVKNPGALQVRKGTKLNDLLTMLEWPEEADLRTLKKKRNLKDQEVIKVSSKIKESQ